MEDYRALHFGGLSLNAKVVQPKFCKCGKPLAIFQNRCFDCRSFEDKMPTMADLLVENVRTIPEEGVDFIELRQYDVVLSRVAHITVFAEDKCGAKDLAMQMARNGADWHTEVEMIDDRPRTRQVKPDGKTLFDKTRWVEEQKRQILERFMGSQTRLDRWLI